MSNSPHSLSPLYGNCQVLSPDNILMFRCDDKRAGWYLKRDLAEEVIGSSPLVIRLKFQPKGLGNHGKTWGLTEMANRCVNCGTTDMLNRHHVVPYCYRKFFPLSLKSHNFHDVLALCVSCHEKYERNADKLKEQLSTEYNAPINGETIGNKDLIKFTKIATTLLKEDLTKVPRLRVRKMKRSLKKKFRIDRLTKKKLEELSKVKVTIIKRTHGEMVMSNVHDIQQFVEMWRRHFVENNDCPFLPENWSIKNKLEHNEYSGDKTKNVS